MVSSQSKMMMVDFRFEELERSVVRLGIILSVKERGIVSRNVSMIWD